MGERGLRWRALGETFDPRRNALNLIRLVLAAIVIVGHSWTLGGYFTDPRFAGMTLGGWSVGGFFAISGWLIMGSRLASRPREFYLRRGLRILPGLVVCLLLVAFAFAPLAALVGPGHYEFGDGLEAITDPLFLLGQRTTVGDTLATTPFPDAWAGSLWSLAYEMVCYVLVGALVSVTPRRHLPTVTFAAWLLMVCLAQMVGGSIVVMVGVFFFSGALLYLGREFVPSSPLLAAGLAALTVAAVIESVPGHVVLAGPAVAYLMIWVGAVMPGRVAGVGRRHDISYGVYIYGFPMAQLLAVVGAHELGMLAYVVLTFAGTVPLAVGSWFLVERPAMRLRRRRVAARVELVRA